MKANPNIRFFITQGCNFNCDYCYETSYNAQEVKKMELSVLKHAFLLYKDVDSYDIDIFGGEPLLNLDAVKYIFEKASSDLAIKKVQLITNGFLIDEIFIEHAKMLGSKLRITVSIDGLEEGHDKHRKTHGGDGTYRRSFENIQKLITLGIDVDINYCILPDTVHMLTEGIKNLLSLGISRIKCMTLPEYKWERQHFKDFIIQCSCVTKIKKNLSGTKISFNDIPTEKVCSEDMSEKISIGVDGVLHTCTLALSGFEIGNREIKNNIHDFTTSSELFHFYETLMKYSKDSSEYIAAKSNNIALCINLQGPIFKQNAKILDGIIRKFSLLS